MTSQTKAPDSGAPSPSSRPEEPAWRALQAHAEQMPTVTLRELFDDARAGDFVDERLEIYVEFSDELTATDTPSLGHDESPTALTRRCRRLRGRST